MPSARILRVNKLIKEQISEILNREDIAPNCFVTVTRVDTSADLKYSKVFLSVYPDKNFKKVFGILEKKIFRIQGSLNKKLFMKPLPRISFVPDTTEKKAQEIENLIKEI